MAEIQPPNDMQNLTNHTAEGVRMVYDLLLDGREGVRGTADFAVTQNGTPNMSVNIAAGQGVVKGDAGSQQGVYIVRNDGTVNKTIAASDATNPRIDLVCARVRDGVYGDSTNDWSFIVVTGTAAASPTAPAVPNNHLPIAQVTVPANASSIVNANIADVRPRVSAIGARRVCTSTTRPATGLYAGLEIFETDTLRNWAWDGSAWVELGGLAYASFHTFTPTFRWAANTAWTLGNGSYKCYYIRQGKMVDVYIQMGIGSTTSGTGTGELVWNPPSEIAPVEDGGNSFSALGMAQFISSGVGRTSRAAVWDGARVIFVDQSFPQGLLASNAPFTWKTGDAFMAQLRYRIA